MTEKQTKQQQIIQEAIKDFNPMDPLGHAVLFGTLKGRELINQKQYATEINVSDRTLRGYIQKHRKDYEKALDKAEKALAAKRNPLSSGRTLSESDLDAFVSSLIESAIKPDATVRDKSLLIDFAGLKAEDILSLSTAKNRKLSWFIKGNLSSIGQYLKVKDLAVMIEGSSLLERDDIRDSGNKQRFIDSDISDESFKLELMYQGLLFGSLFNQVQHPDLPLVAAAVRLQRLSADTEQLSNGKYELKPYVKGKDIEYKEPVTRSEEETAAEIEALLIEIYEGDLQAYEADKAKRETVKKVVTAPTIDKSAVRQRQSQYSEELKVIVTMDEYLSELFSN